MNSFKSIENQLDQLGQELGHDEKLAQFVMDRLLARSPHGDRRPDVPPPRRLRRQVTIMLAAMLLLCLGLWWGWQPQTLYARMLEALANAETVHATGWTRQIVRMWPLEYPQKNADDNDPKYAAEAWYWTGPDGMHRSYERQGPVTVIRHGGEMREYQSDVDLTFIYGRGFNEDRAERFSRLAEFLSSLDRPSLRKEDLGTRREKGSKLRGIRHIEGNRIRDYWIEEQTNLLVRLIESRKDSGEQIAELTFAINEPVPETIVHYEPPKSKQVRYGGGHENVNLQWRQHVQLIGLELQRLQVGAAIAILPREDSRTFSNQWPLQTPDSQYWVNPLDIDQYSPMTLRNFILRRAATEEGERRHGTWRLSKELHDIEIQRSDLVYKDGTPWEEWVGFVLNKFDLEYVDVVENRTVWVAKQDGRALKPWKEVHPPVPYIVQGGVEQKGIVAPGIGHRLVPVTLEELFADFNRDIDSNELSANKPWILDETGLPKPPPYDESKHGTFREYREKVIDPQFLVATDSPWFAGHESLQIAKDWYLKEFGIKFIVEVQPITVHVVRRKQ